MTRATIFSPCILVFVKVCTLSNHAANLLFCFFFFPETFGSENQVALLFINFVARLKCYCQL